MFLSLSRKKKSPIKTIDRGTQKRSGKDSTPSPAVSFRIRTIIQIQPKLGFGSASRKLAMQNIGYFVYLIYRRFENFTQSASQRKFADFRYDIIGLPFTAGMEFHQSPKNYFFENGEKPLRLLPVRLYFIKIKQESW